MTLDIDLHADARVEAAAHELALRGFRGPGNPEVTTLHRYHQLVKAGSRLWLDTGDGDAAAAVWAAEIEALTTNNTLVNQVVQTGAMDDLIALAARELKTVRPNISDRGLVVEVGFIVNARLALGLVERFGARVSVELHPDAAFDIDATLVFARRYYRIAPEHFYIKVPLTPDGFIAVRRLSGEGIPVNYTLGFSARQNYLAAKFSNPAFVNVFLGRLNSLVEENRLGDPKNVGEKAALASWEHMRRLRESSEGTQTRQIAASIRSGTQVAALAGVDVLTIPPKAAREYLDSSDDVTGPRSAADLEVCTSPSVAGSIDLGVLWEVDGRFAALADEAAGSADRLKSGADLAALAKSHGVDLFYDWSDSDRAEIRRKGKIPDLSRWHRVPLDDLMSTAALESFAVDQAQLDARIERIIRSS